MITTVTLNPALDKTVVVDGFNYGELNRVIDSRTDVGGKGINAAVVYRELGGESLATGISYLTGVDQIVGYLKEQGVASDFAIQDGSVKVNLKILDSSKGV